MSEHHDRINLGIAWSISQGCALVRVQLVQYLHHCQGFQYVLVTLQRASMPGMLHIVRKILQLEMLNYLSLNLCCTA
jgi:hypothetical protein